MVSCWACALMYILLPPLNHHPSPVFVRMFAHKHLTLYLIIYLSLCNSWSHCVDSLLTNSSILVAWKYTTSESDCYLVLLGPLGLLWDPEIAILCRGSLKLFCVYHNKDAQHQHWVLLSFSLCELGLVFCLDPLYLLQLLWILSRDLNDKSYDDGDPVKANGDAFKGHSGSQTLAFS